MLAASLPSAPIHEVSPNIEITHYEPVKPITASYEAQTTLEPIYIHLPNPCINGCGYAEANCTQWAAMVREGMGFPVGNNWGNANDWPGNAASEGLELGSKPIVGAVAVRQYGEFGHVMVVLEVYPDGSFLITERNYDWNGGIRERVIPNPEGLIFIYY